MENERIKGGQQQGEGHTKIAQPQGRVDLKKIARKHASGIPNYQNADRHHSDTGTSSQQGRERGCDVCGSELQKREESCPRPLSCQRGLGVIAGADTRLRGDRVVIVSGGADVRVRGQVAVAVT